MSDLEILKQSGTLIREVAAQFQSGSTQVEETSELLQRVIDIIEPVVNDSKRIDDARREQIQKSLLSANLRVMECVLAGRKAKIELDILLLAPELRADNMAQ